MKEDGGPMTWDERVALLGRFLSGKGPQALDELRTLREPLFTTPEEFDRAFREILESRNAP